MDDKEENLVINKKEDYCIILVNPKIYELDVIYSAAYVFLDRAYIILDGDPENEIVVELRLKKGTNEEDIGKKEEEEELERLGREFFNELLNYGFYKKQSEKNSKIREAFLQRALVTNVQELRERDDLNVDSENMEELDRYLDDVEGIKIPWKDEENEPNENK